MKKNHLVFPLVPNACDYAKLNEYFEKLQNSKIEVLQAQGDFGGNLSARKVFRAKTTIARQNGKSRIDNFGNGRRDSKYALTSDKYDFRMLWG